ncbi:MAG: hypothetical protein K0Q57_410 [Gammaproteobacteria bacterium]|jgi:uncharacterized membrane protein YgaE (UPF0421/DUF939 family)|nr:hypothetical protein [Gammaproteobacteria bacterium]
MKLSIEAKLGCRAAIAVLIAVAVSHLFHLGRGYWAVLTTLALISQSWGESLQKAYTRFGMTIAGCIVGYVLFLLVGHIHWLIVACLLLGIFGMAYFFAVSYVWAMFFVGILLVFLFAYLSSWSLEVLWERIYETAIGCTIAAVVSGIFMPSYSRQAFYQKLPEVLENARKVMDSSFQFAQSHQAPALVQTNQTLSTLFMQIKTLTKEYATAKYEMIVMLQQRKAMELFLQKLELSFHYLSSLVLALRLLSSQPLYAYSELELQALWKYLQQVMGKMHDSFNRKEIESIEYWESSAAHKQLQERFVDAKQSGLFGPDEMMHFVACVYYSRMLDKTLREMTDLLIQK